MSTKKIEIEVDGILYNNLTDEAGKYLKNILVEYSDNLINEAINIEKMENSGETKPEVTAAHLKEAKWVSLRRLRRKSSSKHIIYIRIAQGVMATLMGIGASNFSDTWGAILTIIAVLINSILIIAERELNRED